MVREKSQALELTLDLAKPCMKIKRYSSFDDLPESSLALFVDASTDAGIFLSLPWFRNLTETVPEIAQRLRIYSVESDATSGVPTMLLPMCHDRLAKGFFTPRHLSAAANFYSALFNPVTGSTSASVQSDMNALAVAIAAERPCWDTVDLHPMSPGSPLYAYAMDAFRHAGMLVDCYFCFGNYYLEVKGRCYQEYAETLPSTLKNTLKRKARQLENPHELRIKLITTVDEIAEGIAVYEAVYASSWKSPEPYLAFMPGLIRTCAEMGCLRMGVAYVGDQPAAAQIWMVYNGVASIYKLAYDEQFAKLSVGSLLTSHLMQHVIDVDQVREVDYLMGDEPYKQDWMSARRERWGMIAFNPRSVRGLLAALRHFGGRAWRVLKKP